MVRDPRVQELQLAVRGTVADILANARLAGVVRDDVMAEDLITTALVACRPTPRRPWWPAVPCPACRMM